MIDWANWKMWVAALFVAAAAVLRFLGLDTVADAVLAIGGALGLLGVNTLVKRGFRSLERALVSRSRKKV